MEVIVKYNGDIRGLGHALHAEVEILSNTYAIVTLPQNDLAALQKHQEIEYMELPKMLTPLLHTPHESMTAACIPVARHLPTNRLTGKGVAVAVIDSGIDYTHPDFINEDSTTRILYFWDQLGRGNPPNGFKSGAEYTANDINAALKAKNPLSVIPQLDALGHGTGVAGIAVGNGRAQGPQYTGAAPEAGIIGVRLGFRGNASFARTTELMRALRYVVDKAKALRMPLAVNISYGSNNGAHDGRSLFEAYLNEVEQEWKTVICVASGNEGAGAHHYRGKVLPGGTKAIRFSIGPNQKDLFMTVWKSFSDRFTFRFITPNNEASEVIMPEDGARTIHIGNASLYFSYGQPTHYTTEQEVYFQFGGVDGGSVPAGIWTLLVVGGPVLIGSIDIWLPTMEKAAAATAFLEPRPETTLTLPSTALHALTVGGYHALTNSIAPFSGRGPTRNNVYMKPDIVAPAVDVVSASIGGGYGQYTGTSFAAPFVTGAAALMMQWGIVDGNDPYLYGQKIKAYMQKNAVRREKESYPNPVWGYGVLCLKNVVADLLHTKPGNGGIHENA